MSKMFNRLHIIRSLAAAPPHGLRLVFDDGAVAEIDLSPLIASGGVFQPLARWETFRQARLDARGRAVCWPGDVDLCADALWMEATAQGSRKSADEIARSQG